MSVVDNTSYLLCFVSVWLVLLPGQVQEAGSILALWLGGLLSCLGGIGLALLQEGVDTVSSLALVQTLGEVELPSLQRAFNAFSHEKVRQCPLSGVPAPALDATRP